MARIHGWKKNEFTGNQVVDVKLYHTDTTQDVFWSKMKNSYVLVESFDIFGNFEAPDGTGVRLLSVNGAGEVRWPVMVQDIVFALRAEKEGWLDEGSTIDEQLKAFRHFNLHLSSGECCAVDQ